jgi:hypothetical protein
MRLSTFCGLHRDTEQIYSSKNILQVYLITVSTLERKMAFSAIFKSMSGGNHPFFVPFSCISVGTEAYLPSLTPSTITICLGTPPWPLSAHQAVFEPPSVSSSF